MASVQCSAVKKSGERCKRQAIKGGTVCNSHGGRAPQVKAMAAVRHEVSQWTLGQAVDDPGEVLLKLVTQSRIRADGYSAELERLVKESPDLRDALVGDSYGEFGKVGEYIRGLAILEAQERDRLAGFASKAIAAGLAERQVRLAERQGELLAELMRAVMFDQILGLTDAQREAMPGAFRRHLALVAGG